MSSLVYNSFNINTIFEALDHGNEDACEHCKHLHIFTDCVPYGGTTVPLADNIECRCSDAQECGQAHINYIDEIKDNSCF